jgi:hypothetical protein
MISRASSRVRPGPMKRIIPCCFQFPMDGAARAQQRSSSADAAGRALPMDGAARAQQRSSSADAAGRALSDGFDLESIEHGAEPAHGWPSCHRVLRRRSNEVAPRAVESNSKSQRSLSAE